MESHNISKGGACIRVVAPSGTSTKTWNFHLTQSTNGQCFVQMPLTLHFSHSVGVFCCLPTASCKWTTHTGTHTGTAPVNLNYRPRYVQSMPIITHVHGAQKSIRHSIDVWTRGSGPCKTPVLRHAALEVDHPSAPPPPPHPPPRRRGPRAGGAGGARGASHFQRSMTEHWCFAGP